MRKLIAVVLTCCVVLLWRADLPAQQAADFSGRVLDTAGRGIENLEVKLTPPRDSRLPIRVGSTNRDGEFMFRQLARGPYLVEVSQGVYLLYRAQVDTSRQSRVDVTLRRR
jgi:Carboxypeptidase regulatory-like domain